MTSLGDFLKALRDEAAKVRSRAYTAYRGAVNWAAFDFTRVERAVAVMCDECNVFPVNDAAQPATITMEMFARRKLGDEAWLGIDDDLADQMREDARSIIEAMITRKNVSGDSVALAIDTKAVKAIETHDAKLQVQGLIVTFEVQV